MKKITVLFLTSVLALFVSCGSSSDSSSSDTGALVLRVNPQEIKVDTISFVSLIFSSINFDDLDKEGLTIKFLLPKELDFVKGTAVLVLRNGAIQIEPIYSGVVGEVDEDEELEQLASKGSKFLIFSILGSTLGKETTGTVEFNVRGTERETAAKVSVDLDKGAVENFSVSNPGFDAEATTEVNVIRADDDD